MDDKGTTRERASNPNPLRQAIKTESMLKLARTLKIVEEETSDVDAKLRALEEATKVARENGSNKEFMIYFKRFFIKHCKQQFCELEATTFFVFNAYSFKPPKIKKSLLQILPSKLEGKDANNVIDSFGFVIRYCNNLFADIKFLEAVKELLKSKAELPLELLINMLWSLRQQSAEPNMIFLATAIKLKLSVEKVAVFPQYLQKDFLALHNALNKRFKTTSKKEKRRSLELEHSSAPRERSLSPRAISTDNCSKDIMESFNGVLTRLDLKFKNIEELLNSENVALSFATVLVCKEYDKIIEFGFKLKEQSSEFAEFVAQNGKEETVMGLLKACVEKARANEEKLKTGFLRNNDFIQHFIVKYMDEKLGFWRQVIMKDWIDGVLSLEPFSLKYDPEKVIEKSEIDRTSFMAITLCDSFVQTIKREAMLRGVPKHLKFLLSIANPKEYSAIFFLRFFTPAVIFPNQYKIFSDVVDPAKMKNLVFVGKVLQRIANRISSTKKLVDIPMPRLEAYMKNCLRKEADMLEGIFNVLKQAPISEKPFSIKEK